MEKHLKKNKKKKHLRARAEPDLAQEKEWPKGNKHNKMALATSW